MAKVSYKKLGEAARELNEELEFEEPIKYVGVKRDELIEILIEAASTISEDDDISEETISVLAAIGAFDTEEGNDGEEGEEKDTEGSNGEESEENGDKKSNGEESEGKDDGIEKDGKCDLYGKDYDKNSDVCRKCTDNKECRGDTRAYRTMEKKGKDIKKVDEPKQTRLERLVEVFLSMKNGVYKEREDLIEMMDEGRNTRNNSTWYVHLGLVLMKKLGYLKEDKEGRFSLKK